jgi:hypothetical protein
MKKRTKVGSYKPKETNVEKLRVFLAKLNTKENVK